MTDVERLYGISILMNAKKYVLLDMPREAYNDDDGKSWAESTSLLWSLARKILNEV